MTYDYTDTAKQLDTLAIPLAKRLGKIRRAVEAMTDDEIRRAQHVLRRCRPCCDGADIEGAHDLLVAALERESGKRIARKAPWLKVQTAGGNGRRAVCVSHNQQIAMWRDFPTDEEASAAASAISEFLALEGRTAAYAPQDDQATTSLADSLAEIDQEVPF
jgi:hypothetical protein